MEVSLRVDCSSSAAPCYRLTSFAALFSINRMACHLSEKFEHSISRHYFRLWIVGVVNRRSSSESGRSYDKYGGGIGGKCHEDPPLSMRWTNPSPGSAGLVDGKATPCDADPSLPK